MWQVKGLDVDTLYVSHIQVNQAQKQRRRTYRAHGRINRKFIWSWSSFRLLCFATACMFLMLQLNMFKPPVAAYMSSPCHIELILSEKEEPVKKEVCVVLCTLFVSHLSDTSDTVVLIWLICLIFRRSLRLRPGRLKEGSSAVLEWVVGCRCLIENFGWLSVASFISVLLDRSVTLISVCTAYAIRSYEWSVCGFFPYLYWWRCQCSLNVLVVAGGWCWFSLREQYCRLVGG